MTGTILLTGVKPALVTGRSQRYEMVYGGVRWAVFCYRSIIVYFAPLVSFDMTAWLDTLDIVAWATLLACVQALLSHVLCVAQKRKAGA
jgi:hypothetical protein